MAKKSSSNSTQKLSSDNKKTAGKTNKTSKSSDNAKESGSTSKVHIHHFKTIRSLMYCIISQGGGLKPATAINVRHILCEKQSKALEALEKIKVSLCFFFTFDTNNMLNTFPCYLIPAGRPVFQQSSSGIL